MATEFHLTTPNDVDAEGGSNSFVREWAGDWSGKLLIFLGLMVGLYTLYLYFHWGGEEYKSIVSNLVTLFISAGPAILAWRASRIEAISRRTSLGWMMISLGNLAFTIGTIQWIYYENILGENPFPSYADVGYLASYPFMMGGLLLLVERMRTAEERINFVLDTSIIMVGGGMALWYFLLRPIANSYEGDSLTTALSLAYPLSDLVLLLGISSLLLRRTSVASRGVIDLLMVGVVLNFVADFIFSYQSLLGTYETGNPVDALFSWSGVPIMMAAQLQIIAASRNDFAERSNIFSGSRYIWVPYVAVGVVFLTVFKLALDGDHEIIDEAIFVAGLVTMLVIVRQFMFVKENIKANLALSEMQERIQGIYSASTDAIGLADFEGTITEVNDSFVRLTGYRREEIVGLMKYQDFLPHTAVDLSHAPDGQHITGPAFEHEISFERKDGTRRNVTTSIYTVNGADGAPAAIALVVRDITDRRSLEKQLTYQALHDPLTGLANRTLLSKQVRKALIRAKRRGSKIAVLFLDLDNFKTVNDSLGHASGDALLIAVAERLRSCLRAADMAARLGGDEFAVLIEDVERTADEISVADRILASLRQPVVLDGKQIFVGSSIGIALSSDNTEEPDTLLRNADVAMYTAKRNGKNRYAVYEESMHAAVVERAQLETDLRKALENDEFSLRYQPILDLATNRVVALETLLRWDHPLDHSIGPAEFIPIAEEMGIIGPIGEMVLRVACGQATRWHQMFDISEPFAISVNISGRQFLDPSFTRTLERTFKETGLSPQHLILEITESTMISNSEATMRRFAEVKKLGVKIAIDDFGTGFSSLSYLHRFPVDVLKIDSSFVENVCRGNEGAAMVNAIVSMGRTLSLTTVAEGIESEDQAAALIEMDCNWGQGYYFSKPLKAEEITDFMSATERNITPIIPSSIPNHTLTGDIAAVLT